MLFATDTQAHAPGSNKNPLSFGDDQTIVDCVTYTTTGGRGGTKNLRITISIVDDLGDPVTEDPVGQGLQGRDIGIDGVRLMDCANKIFAARQVDRGLAAD